MQQEKEKIRIQYDSQISSKQKGFEVTMKMIATTVQRMVDSSIISNDVNVCGRLKSFKSAYENVSKGKKIDDCFGIRIISGTEQELDKIRKTLGTLLVIKRDKNHKTNNATKYNAFHQMARMKEEFAKANDMELEDFPVVEIQYWTREIEKACVEGELAYSKYKQKDMKKIWNTYKKNPEGVYELLPKFYEASGEEIYRLSPEQALFKMYPEMKTEEKDVEENVVPGECAL